MKKIKLEENTANREILLAVLGEVSVDSKPDEWFVAPSSQVVIRKKHYPILKDLNTCWEMRKGLMSISFDSDFKKNLVSDLFKKFVSTEKRNKKLLDAFIKHEYVPRTCYFKNDYMSFGFESLVLNKAIQIMEDCDIESFEISALYKKNNVLIQIVIRK